MANAAGYMTVEVNGTPVEGEVTSEGREKSIGVHSYMIAVSRYVDVSGDRLQLGQGSFDMPELNVTKDVDKSTPLLYTACRNADPCTVKIERWEANQKGEDAIFLTVTLDDCRISSVSSSFSPGTGGAMENVSFAYMKMTIKKEEGNVQVVLDRNAKKAA